MTPSEKASIQWFLDKVKGLRGSSGARKRVPQKAFLPAIDTFIGGLFYYVYDAKHKATLPYWDAFPLVIPIELYEDGFLGLNLHYLPPVLRRKLLNQLLVYKKRAGSRRAYMALSYEMLKTAAASELFQPCIHRYLSSHIRSQVVRVLDDQWEHAIMLPLHNFQKKSAAQVWRKVKK